MSTSALTLRWPQRARRSTIQAGVRAWMFTSRTMRPLKRPHRSGACTSTGRRSACDGATGGNAGAFSGEPVSAETSRATPNTLRPWARLGVSLRVKTVSSSRSKSRTDMPKRASSASSSRPPCSSAIFSSLAEHSMPRLSTPRSSPTPILKGLPSDLLSSAGGSSAPTVASGTRMPTRALGAPQTICSSSGPPASTWHTRRRSACGCGSTATMRATTTPVKGGATGRRSSTSMPDMVSRSARAWVLSGGLQNSRNHDSGNCMAVSWGRCRCRGGQLNCARKRRSPSNIRRRSSMP